MSLLQIALGPFRNNFPPSWYFNELYKFMAAEQNKEKDPFKANIDLIVGNIQKAYEYQRMHPEQVKAEHTPSTHVCSQCSNNKLNTKEQRETSSELPEEPLPGASENNPFGVPEAEEIDQLKKGNAFLNGELLRLNLELEQNRSALDFMHNYNIDVSNQLKNTKNYSEAEFEALQKTIHGLKKRIINLEFENHKLGEHNYQISKRREEMEEDIGHLKAALEDTKHDLQREKKNYLEEREKWDKLRKQLKSARDEANYQCRKERQCRDESDNKLKTMEDTLNFHQRLADFNFKLSRQFQEVHAEHMLKIEDGLAMSWTFFNEATKQLSVRCDRLQKEKERRRNLRDKLNRLRNKLLSKHHRRLDRKQFV